MKKPPIPDDWVPTRLVLAHLKPYGKNPRIPRAKGHDDLDRSIARFGCAEPIVCQPDFTVIGGHQRLHVLTKRGVKEAWCFVSQRQLSKKEFEELNIRLNKNIAGQWDWNVLASRFNPEQLADFGFDAIETDLNFGMPPPSIGSNLSPRDDNSGVVMLELLFDSEEGYTVVSRMLKALTAKHACQSMGHAFYLEVMEQIEEGEK